jgi:hypothetical protein
VKLESLCISIQSTVKWKKLQLFYHLQIDHFWKYLSCCVIQVKVIFKELLSNISVRHLINGANINKNEVDTDVTYYRS